MYLTIAKVLDARYTWEICVFQVPYTQEICVFRVLYKMNHNVIVKYKILITAYKRDKMLDFNATDNAMQKMTF